MNETEVETKRKLKPLVEIYLTSEELIRIYKRIFSGWKFEIIRIDSYTEYYEKEGKQIKWQCDFVALVAKKSAAEKSCSTRS